MEAAAAPRLAVRKQFARDSPPMVQPGMLAALYSKSGAPPEHADGLELETKLLQVTPCLTT